MKRAGNLLALIMDLGKELLVAGGEVWRVEEVIEEICEAYCFKETNLWTISTCLHATVSTWDDRMYTQIRSVDGRKYDLDKLELLYGLAHDICETPIGINTVRERLDAIVARPGMPENMRRLGMALAVAAFTICYSGTALDALVGACAALLLSVLDERIRGMMNNLLAYNIFASFIVESFILLSFACGISTSTAAITTSVILLFIGGLGVTNGIGDILHGHTLSGISETSTSLLGAGGIAIGISLSLMMYSVFRPGQIDLSSILELSSPVFRIFATTIGCIGFALIFAIKGRALVYCGIGAALTYTVFYLVDVTLSADYFTATIAASMFVAIYAYIVNLATKIPSAVFQIGCVFPLIPGSNLYFMLLGMVSGDNALFADQGKKLILITIGIALGFIIVDVIEKIIRIYLIKKSGIRD